MTAAWSTADRISDGIVDLINGELDAMKDAGKIEPTQLLAGQLLGLMATFSTMPLAPLPGAVIDLQVAVRVCIDDMLENA